MIIIFTAETISDVNFQFWRPHCTQTKQILSVSWALCYKAHCSCSHLMLMLISKLAAAGSYHRIHGSQHQFSSDQYSHYDLLWTSWQLFTVTCSARQPHNLYTSVLFHLHVVVTSLHCPTCTSKSLKVSILGSLGSVGLGLVRLRLRNINCKLTQFCLPYNYYSILDDQCCST